MALASWTGLYTPVVQSLMRQKRIKELLLLQTISQHADPFGFAFPGPKALMGLMRCSKKTLEGLSAFLEEGEYIKIYRTYNPRRGKTDTDYQINPCVLYVRDELQGYCQALWDGGERDFRAEKIYRQNLSSTKESQPESESESESESVTRIRNQSQHHHTPTKKNDARPMTTRQREAQQNQRPQAQDSKDNPQAGGALPKRDLTPFRKALATLDDEQLAQDIKLTVGTQISQARYAVATYNRAQLCVVLELVRQKRGRGELAKPGGYFFATLDNGDIVPAEDGPPLFPPRHVYGDTPAEDSIQHWNPETGAYGPAVGE